MCSSESSYPRLRCPTQHAGTSRAYSRKERQLEGRRDSDRRRSILTAFAPAVPFSVGANRFSSSHIGARRGPDEARAKGIVFRCRFEQPAFMSRASWFALAGWIALGLLLFLLRAQDYRSFSKQELDRLILKE